MTHRFDLKQSGQTLTIFFQGRLGKQALAELKGLCQSQRRFVRVLLGAGTQVEPDLLEDLARLDGITLEAESPFLSRWIQSCLPPAQPLKKEHHE